MRITNPLNMDEVVKKATEVLTDCTSAHFHKSFMGFGAVLFLMFGDGSTRVFSAKRSYLVDDNGYYYSWAFKEVRYVLTEV